MEGPGGPLPWPIGVASVAAIILLRRFFPSSFFLHGVFLFRVFLLYWLTAAPRALLSAARASQSWMWTWRCAA